jgi:Zn-finger nucleic acid-binding protein
MLCPSCKTARLVMSERSGVEIDYCPDCRGVWLDRGELDKIIERMSAAQASQAQQPSERSYSERPAPRQADYDHHRSDGYHKNTDGYHKNTDGYYKKKKREGFLADLFDF